MPKALVIKELRESAGVVALAVLAAAFAVSSLVGLSLLPMFQVGETSGIPFVSDSFGFYLSVIIGGLALALGLKHSAWEFGHSTYRFLLHRPVQRASIFWTKLAVGCTLVFGLVRADTQNGAIHVFTANVTGGAEDHGFALTVFDTAS